MRVLSTDGGGYIGLATAAFIAETERHFGKSFHQSFDLFCGTSTGAIIALALASGLSGKEIVGLYENLGTQVFANPRRWSRATRYLKFPFWPLYSNQPLRRAVETAFGDRTLGDLQSSGKNVLITSFSITKGRPRIFKTDHDPSLSLDNKRRLSDIALASSAAPYYFRPVDLECPVTNQVETFCDGGVFANHPALLGLAEAVSHLGATPKEVSILSLSTPRQDLSRAETVTKPWDKRLLSRGIMFWGTRLFSVMIDGTSEISHETLRRLVDWDRADSKYCRIDFPSAPGLGMDIVNDRTTQTLKRVGFDKAADGKIKSQLNQFFI
ncbi:MAG TPA: CBASS cGAMP-activated phospholipase [Pyrinomonadaceae bacterium]|nr:CBASS cGAMP-activated phospholipase [Pyrinomonadaceae bacterium]